MSPYINILRHVEIMNNIPSYYDIKIFLTTNILGNNGLKWPIHVPFYDKKQWSLELYEVINNYIHPIYDNITVLINKKTYQPYSPAKSALK